MYAFGRPPGLKRGVTMADLAAHHAEEVARQFGERGRALQRLHLELVAAGRYRAASAVL